jgi:hypothetical protein
VALAPAFSAAAMAPYTICAYLNDKRAYSHWGNTMRTLRYPAVLSAFLVASMLNWSAAATSKDSSALATHDQRAVELHAIRIEKSDPVVEQINASTRLFQANVTAQSPDGKSTLDNAVQELAYAAALAAANSDPSRPKIVWAYTAPRQWFGQHVPGSRWGIDNPDNVYRNIPIDGSLRYEIVGKLESPGPAQFSFLLYDSYFGEDGRRSHLDTPIAGLRDKDGGRC